MLSLVMVVPKIAPYFTEVDTLLQSPDEKSILATTNLGFKYGSCFEILASKPKYFVVEQSLPAHN